VRKRYSILEAKDHLPRLVRAAERDGAVEITRRGRPVAMLVSMEEYERLHGRRVGFWQALEAFRRGAGRDMWLADDEFLDLRDRGTGRH
jgi:prevent-host-death family protein